MLATDNKNRVGSNPDVARYADIRGALVARGTSLYQWAKRRNYAYTTVVQAARGDRAGKKSAKILAELLKFLPAKEVHERAA